jgi:predicted metalloprotease with PDZ domain
MRLAYKRFAGERGFTPEEFRATAEDVAGVDLKEWFRKATSSTEELDYAEALDWFGLRFAPAEEPAKNAPDEPAKKPAGEPARRWKLEIRADATEAQKGHLGSLLSHAGNA